MYTSRTDDRGVVQARHCGLPENTPLVEQVEVDADAGAPKTAMQIAVGKYRRGNSPAEQAKEDPALAGRDMYPDPKRRDQFLHFSVMPGASSSKYTCKCVERA